MEPGNVFSLGEIHPTVAGIGFFRFQPPTEDNGWTLNCKNKRKFLNFLGKYHVSTCKTVSLLKLFHSNQIEIKGSYFK